MIELEIKRHEDAKADFTEWTFFIDEDRQKLNEFINSILNNLLSTVFSKDGANARLSIDVYDSKAEDLMIHCEIEINEFDAYASAKVPLRNLLEDFINYCYEDDKKLIADSLRTLANEIEYKTG